MIGMNLFHSKVDAISAFTAVKLYFNIAKCAIKSMYYWHRQYLFNLILWRIFQAGQEILSDLLHGQEVY